MKRLFGELARFGLIGGFVAVLQIGSFTVLHDLLHLGQVLSGTVAYVIAVVAHFLLNRAVTFGSRSGISRLQLIRYGGLLLLNYLLTMACLWLATDIARVPAQVGLVVSLVVTALISFFVMKRFIFPPESLPPH